MNIGDILISYDRRGLNTHKKKKEMNPFLKNLVWAGVIIAVLVLIF